MKNAQFKDLVGKTLEKVEASEDLVKFFCTDGSVYSMCHEQDCCGSVALENYSAEEVKNLKGKVLFAYETSKSGEQEDGSYTWTFYNIQTESGFATLRWYGENNGYYSESVSFYAEVAETEKTPEVKVENVESLKERIIDLEMMLGTANKGLKIVMESEKKLLTENRILSQKLREIKKILEA